MTKFLLHIRHTHTHTHTHTQDSPLSLFYEQSTCARETGKQLDKHTHTHTQNFISQQSVHHSRLCITLLAYIVERANSRLHLGGHSGF